MRRRRHAALSGAEVGPIARAVLAVARLVARPLRRFGVDPVQFRTLLTLELVLAERRSKRARKDGEAGPFRGGAVLGFVIQIVFGALSGFLLATVDDPLWAMGGALFVLSALLTMMLVTDYLPALVDTADIDVLASTPVGDRVVLAARVGHVVAYLGVALLGLSVVPVITGSIGYGIVFVPVWIVASLLATATSIGLSFGLFLLAMRLFDLERFRDLLLYLQVGTMVAFVGGAQLLPRMADVDALEAVFETRPFWLALLPPFHGAGLLAFVQGERDLLVIVLVVLAVMVPAVTAWVVFGLVGEGFVARLSAMATGARGGVDATPRRRLLRDLLLRTSTARAGYDFFRALSRRERTFRMRAYPMVALSAVLGIAFALRQGELKDAGMLCGAVYFLGMYAPSIVSTARFSDDHEARWMFQVLPIDRPGDFLVGGLTAMLATFTLPALALLGGLVVAVGGLGLLPDVVFAAEAVLVVTILAMLVLGRTIPFTERPRKNPAEGNMGWMLLMSFVVAIGVLLHVLLRTVPAVFYTALVVQPVVVGLLLRALRRVEPDVRWMSGPRRRALAVASPTPDRAGHR